MSHPENGDPFNIPSNILGPDAERSVMLVTEDTVQIGLGALAMVAPEKRQVIPAFPDLVHASERAQGTLNDLAVALALPMEDRWRSPEAHRVDDPESVRGLASAYLERGPSYINLWHSVLGAHLALRRSENDRFYSGEVLVTFQPEGRVTDQLAGQLQDTYDADVDLAAHAVGRTADEIRGQMDRFIIASSMALGTYHIGNKYIGAIPSMWKRTARVNEDLREALQAIEQENDYRQMDELYEGTSRFILATYRSLLAKKLQDPAQIFRSIHEGASVWAETRHQCRSATMLPLEACSAMQPKQSRPAGGRPKEALPDPHADAKRALAAQQEFLRSNGYRPNAAQLRESASQAYHSMVVGNLPDFPAMEKVQARDVLGTLIGLHSLLRQSGDIDAARSVLEAHQNQEQEYLAAAAPIRPPSPSSLSKDVAWVKDNWPNVRSLIDNYAPANRRHREARR